MRAGSSSRTAKLASVRTSRGKDVSDDPAREAVLPLHRVVERQA